MKLFIVIIRETRDSHLNDFHKFQRLWRSSRGLLSSLAIMPSAPLTTPPPNKQLTLHPKQYHQMFHIFMILIEVLHLPPLPSTPTLKVAANESEMRPHNYGLQFGFRFRPTNRNPEPLKYRWSSGVSPPYIPCCSRPYLSEFYSQIVI